MSLKLFIQKANDLFIRKNGFTLIELLVSASIIAILSTIGYSSYQSVSRSGRDGVRKTHMESIRSALEIYKSDNNSYPVLQTTCKPNLPTSYLNPYPDDPRPSSSSYCYTWVTTSPLNYRVCAHMENGISPTIEPTICGGSTCGSSCNYSVVNP